MNITLKVLLSATGAFTGFTTLRFILAHAFAPAEGKLFVLACCLAGAVLAAIFFASGGFIIGIVGSLYDRAEKVVRSLTIFEVGVACAGLVVGLAISFFITLPLSKLNWVGVVLTVCVNFLFGYSGLAIAVWKCRDIAGTFQRGAGAGGGAAYAGAAAGGRAGIGGIGGGGADGAWEGCPKLLDTSAIIDGRIADIVRTGFLEGPLIVPDFVLAELRHIADSADALKRGKGRRGLDVLSAIQNEMDGQLTIEKLALPEGAEVDAELVSIAQKNGYTILTTDYNLNKVASVQGVRVLNINELNNAIKPVAVPGEIIAAQIVREGKEPGQGVAYMPDGTMIVVEGARSRVGETMAVVLTSVLQTAAGRMIFAKPKPDGGAGNGNGGNNGNGGGAGNGGGNSAKFGGGNGYGASGGAGAGNGYGAGNGGASNSGGAGNGARFGAGRNSGGGNDNGNGNGGGGSAKFGASRSSGSNSAGGARLGAGGNSSYGAGNGYGAGNSGAGNSSYGAENSGADNSSYGAGNGAKLGTGRNSGGSNGNGNGNGDSSNTKLGTGRNSGAGGGYGAGSAYGSGNSVADNSVPDNSVGLGAGDGATGGGGG